MSDRLEARFWERVMKTDGCWSWLGHHAWNGYARVSWRGRNTAAHRVAYELLIGPIPDGLTLDHLCRNRGCVNPFHCEPVTNGENVLRGEGPPAQNARKTHCKNGHPYTEENTYRSPTSGWRKCKVCRAEWNVKLQERRKRERRERRLAA